MTSPEHPDLATGSAAALDEPSLEDVAARLRALPAVHAVMARPTLAPVRTQAGDGAVTRAIRGALDDARTAIRAGRLDAGLTDEAVTQRLALEQRGSLLPTINATGVVVHTNLGRAPLADEALQEVVAVSRGYSTLEYDLDAGTRGSRHGHVQELLIELCGVEDACVVNNNAAALLLALSAIATEKDVIVSRGELVEIGGGFRVPDVMQQGGAKLLEVGTTNRTHPRDFAAAMTDECGAILKVHQSNFAQVGFTTECNIGQLADVVAGTDVPLLYDAGSGCLLPVEAAPQERTVGQTIKDGADLVMFSGDKLLGGPQAGILVGRADLIEKCRRHPLMRAMRPDKMCLAALAATLRLWRDQPERVPVRRMVTTSQRVLMTRADGVRDRVLEVLPGAASALRVVETVGKIGGGTSPLTELPSAALALQAESAETLATRLRENQPPIIARVESERVWLDFATLALDELDIVTAALVRVLALDEPA